MRAALTCLPSTHLNKKQKKNNANKTVGEVLLCYTTKVATTSSNNNVQVGFVVGDWRESVVAGRGGVGERWRGGVGEPAELQRHERHCGVTGIHEADDGLDRRLVRGTVDDSGSCGRGDRVTDHVTVLAVGLGGQRREVGDTDNHIYDSLNVGGQAVWLGGFASVLNV